MAQTVDFQKAKREVLTIIMVDGEKILVRTPTKKIMDKLVAMSADFAELAEDDITPDTLDAIYETCTQILNNNRAGKKYTIDYISEQMDLEDITVFFNAYMEFVNKINQIKN